MLTMKRNVADKRYELEPLQGKPYSEFLLLNTALYRIYIIVKS